MRRDDELIGVAELGRRIGRIRTEDDPRGATRRSHPIRP
jgi:hypothetical protein